MIHNDCPHLLPSPPSSSPFVHVEVGYKDDYQKDNNSNDDDNDDDNDQ